MLYLSTYMYVHVYYKMCMYITICTYIYIYNIYTYTVHMLYAYITLYVPCPFSVFSTVKVHWNDKMWFGQSKYILHLASACSAETKVPMSPVSRRHLDAGPCYVTSISK